MKYKVRHTLRKYTLPFGIIIFGIASAVRQVFSESESVIIIDYFHFVAGLGAGLMFVGAIYKVIFRNSDNSPEAVKQREIDENDERNIRIKEKAGYASWHATLLIFVAMALIFIIIDYPLGYWLSASAIILHKIILLIFTSVYNKKM
jgi:uncharacterized membrane protein